ncbi:MAG: orotidine-5'-phosphate decarboxylase [Phycisphaerales bacterium]|nr:orotidine-5'-phosphate decarboxylase [Phycisphaerales bacterium]
MPRHYADRLAAAIEVKRTPAVVGIDPVAERLPQRLRPGSDDPQEGAAAIERFSAAVIERVAPLVPAVKINSGFFEVFQEHGVAAYYRLVALAHACGLLVIGDVKRGDIGSTAALYARGHLATGGSADRVPDAITIGGYLGRSGVDEFVRAARTGGRGVYVLVRPSDPTADVIHEFGESRKLYQHLAQLVTEWGEAAELRGTCGLSLVGAVVGPKDATGTAALRGSMPHTPWLVPGYGAQGAAAEATRACFLAGGSGAVINASRSVIYAFEDERLGGGGVAWEDCVVGACRGFAAEAGALAGFC